LIIVIATKNIDSKRISGVVLSILLMKYPKKAAAAAGWVEVLGSTPPTQPNFSC
jgi:hypothetical protein